MRTVSFREGVDGESCDNFVEIGSMISDDWVLEDVVNSTKETHKQYPAKFSIDTQNCHIGD